ncbi:unnamed protein product [Malus baccata var. baccata]
MAPKLTAKQNEYILAMADFKLTDQWNNSIEAWEKLKSVDTVNWRNERCVLPLVPHIIRHKFEFSIV